jgi:hypothetical protein
VVIFYAYIPAPAPGGLIYFLLLQYLSLHLATLLVLSDSRLDGGYLKRFKAGVPRIKPNCFLTIIINLRHHVDLIVAEAFLAC